MTDKEIRDKIEEWWRPRELSTMQRLILGLMAMSMLMLTYGLVTDCDPVVAAANVVCLLVIGAAVVARIVTRQPRHLARGLTVLLYQAAEVALVPYCLTVGLGLSMYIGMEPISTLVGAAVTVAIAAFFYVGFRQNIKTILQ